MKTARAAALLLAIVALPHALAAESVGTFTALGAVHLEAPATLSADAEALFCDATSDAEALTFRAARLHVDALTATFVDVEVLENHVLTRTSTERATYTLTDVVVTLAPGDHAGILGIDLDAGAPMGLAAPEASTLTPSAPGRFGNAKTATGPSVTGYGHDVPAAYVLLEGWTRAAYEGSATFKVQGLDLALRAAENATTLRTGQTPGDAPSTNELRWATLTAESVTLGAALGSSCSVASRSVLAAWSGVATFTPVNGALREGGTSYEARGDQATLEGTLRATLAPLDAARMSMDVEGELVRTTLGSTRVAAPLGVGGVWTLALVAGLVATSGTAILLLLRERKRRRFAPSAEQYADLALSAAEAERFDEALGWIERARERAPTSRRLLVEEGYLRERLGQADDALRLYREAAEESGDGEADLMAARLLAKEGRASEAASHVVAALGKSPAVLLDVEGDPALAALAQRYDVAPAVAQARRALRD